MSNNSVNQSNARESLLQRLSVPADDVENVRPRFSSISAEYSQGHRFLGDGCFSFLNPCAGGIKQKPHIEKYDAVLLGGGIMSCTLGVMLQKLEPTWKIGIFEGLGKVGEEASNGWNNAGTGHSALCEVNYTPELKNGDVNTTKAVAINEKFQVSRQFWAHLVTKGDLPQPEKFINITPHMTFVSGDENVRFLHSRYKQLKENPLFKNMTYTEDLAEIEKMAPLMVKGRNKDDKVAATFVKEGTDIDYGTLTKELAKTFTNKGGRLNLYSQVVDLRKEGKTWKVDIKMNDLTHRGVREIHAPFVFVGAGGGSLLLLQKSGIPEIRGFGGFPISGQFLVCQVPQIVEQHKTKVYGKAAVGAPPMSVPHLDYRIIDGKPCLLFGPYAGFSPKFLKTGSLMDLFSSLKPHNIIPMAAAGLQNLDLTVYLVKELLASKEAKLKSLKEFVPEARAQDWTVVTAGQRVQIMKADKKKTGILQFGTEIVTSADGSIAGLLGASPGASVSVQICVDVLNKCMPDKAQNEWSKKLKEMIPSYGIDLSNDPSLAEKIMNDNAKVLHITHAAYKN